MDFALPAADDPRRLELRDWLVEHDAPAPADLARAGLVAPRAGGAPRRRELGDWRAEPGAPAPAAPARAGLVAPRWPEPWGIGANPEHALIIEEELRRAGVALPDNPIGIGWAGPTLLAG